MLHRGALAYAPLSRMVAAALPRILFSDSAILALDKPAGMSTVADPHHAGPALLDLARQIGGEAHLLHRLDRDTSGVVVFARNAAHVAPLVKAFEARAVRKTYHALVAGRPYWSTQLVRAPLRADADREHRTVVDQWRGKDAQTQLDVLERFDACALVQACPLTGRTHQIRVHLTLLGNPIANDSLYARASPQREVTGGLKRLALHAWSIALPHPVTGAVVRIDSPYPADFAEALQELRSRAKPHGRTNPAPG